MPYLCAYIQLYMLLKVSQVHCPRFLRSTRAIYVQHRSVEASRERIYQAALQSQMLQERRPMTIVSLAIKFNAACHELCKQLHPGVDLDTNAKVKQEMLHLAIKEFDDCCANLNKVYMLSSLQRDAVYHCILHSCPTFLGHVQRLLDHCPEKCNPWKLKVLQTTRWVIGGQSPKIGQADANSPWQSVLLMSAEKQALLAEIVNFETQRSLRAGRSKSLTLEEFAELCDYSCWAGFALSNCAHLSLDDEVLKSVRTRCQPVAMTM